MQALHINQLSKIYENGIVALDNINLEVAQGDFFGLLGPNAAGKSTLIGIITSLIPKTAGEVSLFDKNIDEQQLAAKAKISVVPQEFNFDRINTVQSILTTQAGYYGINRSLSLERSDFYLKKLHLWEQRNLEARYLSGGQKRRLMIARALIHEPSLLILDEPTAGVDIETRHTIWQLLRELNNSGMTIILTTHYLEEAETLCKNIAIIDAGKLVAKSAVSTLMKRISLETIVLYLEKPMTTAPALKHFNCKLIDPTTLEVHIDKKQRISDLFHELNLQDINVVTMRNKTNKLEELFLHLTNKENGKNGQNGH
jgi:ABC-2 type transport system ATP-binding protein